MRSSIAKNNIKSPRIVEIFNPEGTVTTYPSIYSVTKSWGFKKSNNIAVYIHVAKGGGRFVDIRIPVEVINEHGTRILFWDINAVARNYGISTMEVNTMISTGKARLMKPIREVITEPIVRRKGLNTKCVVEILNEDRTINRTFKSLSEAARVLKGTDRRVNHIYSLVAQGKARLVYRAEEAYEEEDEEEEVFYDALDQQQWMEEKEEMFYDSLVQQEEEATDYYKLYKKKEEEVKGLKFELPLANVREMIHTGVFSQVLKNSRETDV